MTYKPLDLRLFNANTAQGFGRVSDPEVDMLDLLADAREARKVIAALVEALRSVLGSDGVSLLTSGLTGEDAEGHDPECELCAAASLGRAALALAVPWIESKKGE